jgi:Kef-type K+ transport system membrane component KefB
MSEAEIGVSIVILGIFLLVSHAFGYVFERLSQPRLIGEILAGVFLGPFVLGKIAAPGFTFLFTNPILGPNKTGLVISLIYWLGLLLLMFISGSEVQGLLSTSNRHETAWLLGIGTPLPFAFVMVIGLIGLIPMDPLIGTHGTKLATLLVLASAAAVTSIPVISRIFQDLGILHTRFASLILGTAMLEDVGLWGVLAIATALSHRSAVADSLIATNAYHVGITIAYIGFAMLVVPRLLKTIWRFDDTAVSQHSLVTYAVALLCFFVGAAAGLGVSTVFAAFLAGYALINGIRDREKSALNGALQSIKAVAFGVFVPIYFAIVGYRLSFGNDFSGSMLLTFLLGSSLIVLMSVGLAAKLAGFRGLDIVNLAIVANARGGPGIVLASIAFDAGLISGALCTTLVITALFTSQMAGWWLRFVLRRGWPLLSTNPDEKAADISLPAPSRPLLRPEFDFRQGESRSSLQ